MKKYLSYFTIRFTAGLQYRAAAWAGIATQFAWGFMRILVLAAFERDGGGVFPMPLGQAASYIWIQQATLALFMSWFVENDIIRAVEDGGVAYELCRPLDVYGMWYVRVVANRLSRAMLRCVPILVVAVFIPAPYGLALPSLENFALFLVSAMLGLGTVAAFNMLVYLAGFYTISTLGVRYVAFSLCDFLSGGYLPLVFLPDGAVGILRLLPFASMMDTPMMFASGAYSVSDAPLRILLQVFWLAALVGLGRVVASRALRRVVVQGG